ncbi:SusD/RagB family nutrient-binding outer membrane lipoprotein [Pedobacter cryoconitis]|uniref:SusD-like starch-binding protein associating with outer membrane n=1 Tax=Pedobacter cryoconitis TaxID=188932 RepID=A0A7X0J4P2_9SPHI|nr:SusD/RagB family nutrient-binding outer membrane lipoprotein [Pedobacter cryoconitis]MBB6501081.1 hypothetical protein [Pedobacter cryoconitis]
MKTIFKLNYLLPFLMAVTFSGCKKDFEDKTINNNRPSAVQASLLLNGVLNSSGLVEGPNGSKETYAQYYLNNYDYYGNNRYDFGYGDDYFTTLKNVAEMEKQSLKSSAAVNSYTALGKFFRAYLFSKMSMEMGDIPMTDALQGANNLTPAYDKQKAVMMQCLALLESANTDLTGLIAAKENILAGDIYFNGDLLKWQKTVNTFRLRLLIQLSKRAGDDLDLKVKSQFSDIVSNKAKYPIMESAADNMQYISLSPTNYYPQNPDNFGQSGSRKNTSATYIGLLTKLQDPRVYVTAEPSRFLVDSLKQSPTDFASFVGADAGQDLGVMYNNAGLQKYSFLNRKRYYSTYTGEPSIQVGYAELMFNIAEGINRGWAAGNAETFYIAGIKSSMDSYSIPTGTGSFTAYFYRPGSTNVALPANYDTYTINVNWDNYYNQPAVKYIGSDDGLVQILQQKYLALFRHSGLESYFTYRRTHVPNFTTGPGTGNGGRIASRFQYHQYERTSNTANYQAALQSQYNGNDDINGIMYILK